MSHVQALQEKIIKRIESEGLIHFLEWIGGVYSVAAEAELKDQFEGLDRKVSELDALQQLMRRAAHCTNKSTSAGSNMMDEARIQALANHVERSATGRELSAQRNQAIAESCTKKQD